MEALKNGKTEPLVSQSAQISQIMQRQIALVSSGNASPQSALNLANQQIAQAMINATLMGYEKPVLEVSDIRQLAARDA